MKDMLAVFINSQRKWLKNNLTVVPVYKILLLMSVFCITVH